MSTELQTKIDDLKNQIGQTTIRINETQDKIIDLRPQVEELETALRESKKAYALDTSIDSKKAIIEAQKALTAVKNGLEEAEILLDALADKRSALENEQSKLEHELAEQIIDHVGSKACELVDEYNRSIKAAHLALYKLRLIGSIAQTHKLAHRLHQVAPTCPQLGALCGFPDFKTFEPAAGGGFRNLHDQHEYNKDAVLSELLA